VLPVDLLDSLHGVRRQVPVDGDPGDGAPRQVADHVVDGLELLLQVVRVPASCLGRLFFVYGLAADTAGMDMTGIRYCRCQGRVLNCTD